MQALQYLMFTPVFTPTGYCGLALGVGHTVLVSAATGPTQCLSDKLLSLYSPYGGEDVHGAGATLSAPIKAVLEKNRI